MSYTAAINPEDVRPRATEATAARSMDGIAAIFDLALVRRRAMIAILVAAWLVSLFVFGLELDRKPGALWIAALSIAVNIYPSHLMVRRRFDRATVFAIVLVATVQPFLIYLAMVESGLQPQFPLAYVVAVIALMFLCDTRVLALGTAICVGQLMLLALVAPDWIFFQHGALWRGTSYSLGVAAIGGLGIVFISVLRKLIDELEAQWHERTRQGDLLKGQAAELTAALEQVEKERALNIDTLEKIQEIRKAEYESVAADFEQSISAVTKSLAATVELLRISAHQLKENADAAGEEAQEVLGSAEIASKAANTVAAGIAELSMSIAEVAVHAGQQSDLSYEATERSSGGGKAIGSLTAQSKTIGEATRSIVRIAERTNLLSLNAAIEAASAGPSGRGFSIVAQEVKQLAAQASEAATRIEAFLGGVRSGTLEAERSFRAIDAAIGELGKTSNTIRFDVENQRQSADTIESFARRAAGDSDQMVERSRALTRRAAAAKELSGELERAAEALADNVRDLEQSSQNFTSRLKVA